MASATPNKEYRIKENEVLVNREGENRKADQAPRDIHKATRLYCEEQLLALLSRFLLPSEMLLNERMWRARAKQYPKAIIGVLKQWERLPPEERKKIENRGAWATDQYYTYGGRSICRDQPIEVPVSEGRIADSV